MKLKKGPNSFIWEKVIRTNTWECYSTNFLAVFLRQCKNEHTITGTTLKDWLEIELDSPWMLFFIHFYVTSGMSGVLGLSFQIYMTPEAECECVCVCVREWLCVIIYSMYMNIAYVYYTYTYICFLYILE